MGSDTGAESGSGVDSVWLDISSALSAADVSTVAPGSSALAMLAAAVAIAAAAATAAAISFADSAAVVALGPRFTGVGVLLPTVFLGVEFLVAPILEPGVLEASLVGVGLLSCALGRLSVFVSAALLAVSFLGASTFVADLGVSGFFDFIAGEGRERGESAGFLAAGVAGLETSSQKNTEKRSGKHPVVVWNIEFKYRESSTRKMNG